MNSFIDHDEDARPEERELTLGSGTILAIFVALILVCGAFFGFGYKLGSHQAQPLPQASSASGSAPVSSSNFTSFKPAAGSPLADNAASGEKRPTASEKRETRAAEAAGGAAEPAPTSHELRGHDEPASRSQPETAPTSATPVGTYFVQVAAVSHQEDAQLLIHALKAKGYPVGAHTGTQDKFYHVQVGPFATLAEATAAKQRLSADGYQPIIK